MIYLHLHWRVRVHRRDAHRQRAKTGRQDPLPGRLPSHACEVWRSYSTALKHASTDFTAAPSPAHPLLAKVTLIFNPSSLCAIAAPVVPENLVLWSASLATPEECSSANSTKAMFLRPGIVRTSTRLGYLRSHEVSGELRYGDRLRS